MRRLECAAVTGASRANRGSDADKGARWYPTTRAVRRKLRTVTFAAAPRDASGSATHVLGRVNMMPVPNSAPGGSDGRRT